MAYRIIVLPSAETDLEKLDPDLRRRILRRIVWLGENASQVVHHRLANMPDELAGLCRLRVGNYRVLYSLSSTGAAENVPNSASLRSLPLPLIAEFRTSATRRAATSGGYAETRPTGRPATELQSGASRCHPQRPPGNGYAPRWLGPGSPGPMRTAGRRPGPAGNAESPR